MKIRCMTVAFAATLSVLVPGAAALEEPRLPCKNHYILRCAPDEPNLAWSALPDSLEARYRGHTATVLADSRVLVVGGGDYVYDAAAGSWGIAGPAGAEVLDTVAGSWQPTAPMNRLRMNHLAVRLLDGRVLVVGGDSRGNLGDERGTAELFDPATGTWSMTGGLVVPRAGFTATLLPDGRVLAAGGVDVADNTLGSAEVYDPAAGTWRLTGSLVEPRLMHTATALPDGRVLVVGGMTDDFFMTTTGSAEVFDPTADTWSAAGSIDARWLHTATLTDEGKVVVAGGYISVPGRGGWYVDSDVDSTAIFDPAAGTWSHAGELNYSRHAPLAARLRGHGVVLFGGQVGLTPIPGYTVAPVELAELLLPGGTQWREALSPPVSSSHYHSATELADGSILFLGDLDGARALVLRAVGSKPLRVP
jgi:hypothetical protein